MPTAAGRRLRPIAVVLGLCRGSGALGGVVARSSIAVVPGGGRQRHDGPGEDGGNSYVQKLYLLVASQINVIAN